VTEPWFSSDEYLVPVLENDLLIRALHFASIETQRLTHLFLVEAPSDDWSDSEDEEVGNADPTYKIKILEKKLALAQQSLVDYRTLITEKCNIPNLFKDINEPISRQAASSSRDDDTHYFRSYGEHGQPITLFPQLLFCDTFVTRYPRSHDPG
jgi:protein arginine N-methyltransferase 3